MDERINLFLLILFIVILYILFAFTCASSDFYHFFIATVLLAIFIILCYIFLKLYELYQLFYQNKPQVSDRQPGIIEYYTENFNTTSKRHRRYRSVSQ